MQISNYVPDPVKMHLISVVKARKRTICADHKGTQKNTIVGRAG